jgi:two-component system, chemotaxis family, response regulator WspF
MKIGIVNDMALAVEALRRVIQRVPTYSVAWVARDGAEAVRLCKEQRPDVILMDLIMPVMNGVETTRTIMAETPTPILVVTTTVSGNMSKVYEAMAHGALDAVNTPVLAGPAVEGGQALLDKLVIVGKLLKKPAAESHAPIIPRSGKSSAGSPLVAIGSSTGGPQALLDILKVLPRPLEASVVIVQHVDVEFAPGLATWLHERTKFPVELAVAGRRPTPGVALLAATNDHLVLEADGTLRYTRLPKESPYRPSVDALFKSIALHWPSRAVGVLLTGMGRDGAEGLLRMKEAGFPTIAQDERTSVVFGMPKAAIELGAADRVLPVQLIGSAILDTVLHSAPRT